MKLEHKSFGTASVQAPDDEPGVLEAVVSVFNNVDHGKDRIRPGFFAKSLERKLPKGVWGHDWASPIAKTLEARELLPGDALLPDPIKHLGGLYIRGQFNLDTQRGREAYSDVKFGIIDEFSIGYRTTRAETDKKSGVRDLIEGEVHEWSPVLVGMNDQTQLLSVKGRGHQDKPGNPATSSSDESGAGLVSRPTLKVQARDTVSVVEEFASRVESRLEARERESEILEAEGKVGRVLSSASETEIEAAIQGLETSLGRLKSVLERSRSKRRQSKATTPTEADGATAPPPATPPAIEAKSTRVDPAVAAACYTRLMDTRRLALLAEVAGA